MLHDNDDMVHAYSQELLEPLMSISSKMSHRLVLLLRDESSQ